MRDAVGTALRETLLKKTLCQQIRRDEDPSARRTRLSDHVGHPRFPGSDVPHPHGAGMPSEQARRGVNLMAGTRVRGSRRREHNRITTAPSGRTQPPRQHRGQYRIGPQRLRDSDLRMPAERYVLRNVVVHMVSRRQEGRK
ncbi:Uncharacterised protein [Mycobacteroides abscessus subsp. abscessus]|nr:Uncharacterised protein [Mycobacteroides abscessus subsp. abscessus]